MLDTSMPDQVPFKILPPRPHDFHSLPAGFEYEHEISETSNTSAFDTRVDDRDLRRCVVCGTRSSEGPRPNVVRAHVIDQTEDRLWAFLKKKGFVPSFAKSLKHEPRNYISLCVMHLSDFYDYRFFIRWVPSASIFVFVNFSRTRYLEKFHGKAVVLDANHHHSPFPAPFLIQEMRTRGFHPWYADRPIPPPSSTTYTLDNNIEGDVTDLPVGGGSGTGFGLGGSGGMDRPGGNGGAASSSSEPQQYLDFGNPFRDPKLLDSMRCQWQQLPNWKAATIEGLTWEGTAEENAKKYFELVGVSTD